MAFKNFPYVPTLCCVKKYSKCDEPKKNIKEYNRLIKSGLHAITTFFQSSFKNEFTIFIHPTRKSLDSAWQKDWNMPTFSSECWMVASGVADKLDVLSPKRWDKESCEHVYAEKIPTQQLITHELVHVYHGQNNSSPDFSDLEDLDWFIEGLATYASGQCTAVRLKEVKKAILEGKIPNTVNAFGTGNLKYGLSGSLVQYIDFKYGREKVNLILPLDKKSEAFSILSISEPELLEQWKIYIQGMP